jgi:hypothetical protein
MFYSLDLLFLESKMGEEVKEAETKMEAERPNFYPVFSVTH